MQKTTDPLAGPALAGSGSDRSALRRLDELARRQRYREALDVLAGIEADLRRRAPSR